MLTQSKRKLILVGNANVGKTTIYNGLTSSNEKVGNFQGVTVDLVKGAMKGYKDTYVVDLPGLDGFETKSLDEFVAKKEILKKEQSIFVCVIDVNNFEKSIPLLNQLLKLKRPMVMVLNFYKDFLKRGGQLDVENLSNYLGIPIFILRDTGKQTFKKLKMFLNKNMLYYPKIQEFSLQNISFKRESKVNKIENIFKIPFVSILAFLSFMMSVFYMAFGNNMLGEVLKNFLEKFLLENVYVGTKNFLLDRSANEILISFICDAVIKSSCSLLTFLPQLSLLYFALIFLEECGLTSYVAYSFEKILYKFNLSGRVVFSLFMGFGCTTAGILCSKCAENKACQNRVIFLLPYFSCSAKLPLYLTLLSPFFKKKFLMISLLYLLGVFIGFFLLLFSKNQKVYKKTKVDVVRLRLPTISQLVKPLIFYLKEYIIKISTIVLSFLIIVWFMNNFTFSFKYTTKIENSMLSKISVLLKYFFYPMGIYDWRISMSALMGLISKESVAGSLTLFLGDNLPFILNARSSFAFCLFIMTCPPCFNAIIASNREIGVRKTLKNFFIQLLISFLISYFCYFLSGLSVLCIIVFLLFILSIFIILLKRRI